MCALLCAGGTLAGSSALTDKEQAVLAAGELVKRPVETSRDGLDLLGGQSYLLVEGNIELVWSAMLDVERYQKMIPACSKAKILVDRGNERVVRIEHKVGFVRVDYDITARLYPERHDIKLLLERVKKRGPRAAWGYLMMRPRGDDHVMLSWDIMVDPGRGLFVRMLRPVVHDWMLRVPEGVKRWVESPHGRRRYEEQLAKSARAASAT